MPEVAVLDSTMAYREVGTGMPFVLLHGNPTSSYEWRSILPAVGTIGRALAPDLIGMGQSGKPASAYRFVDHARYLDAWFDALDLDDVVLVGHDWGGALAFDWAARHPGRVRGVAFMETIVRPMPADAFPPGHPFRSILTPGVGETMVLDENFFTEQALFRTVLTPLSDEDLAEYRKPYPTRESRRPLLQWARSMPVDGEPADVVARIEAYDQWLAKSEEVPKLLLTFDGSPTLMIDDELAAWCATNMAGLEVEACGPAGHIAPEDQPGAIATAVVAWANRHGLADSGAGQRV
jgi:haloalkane dehalogenase